MKAWVKGDSFCLGINSEGKRADSRRWQSRNTGGISQETCETSAGQKIIGLKSTLLLMVC